MTLDDLPFDAPPADPTRPERPSRRCLHPRRDRRIHPPTGQDVCARCGTLIDPARQSRGRRSRNRGNAIQRQRIVRLGGKNRPGNDPNHDGDGLMFSYESKSGNSVFSERLWRWLTGIPTRADQTQVLIVTDTPGPGRRARSYIVVDYDQWLDLHGEVSDAATE